MVFKKTTLVRTRMESKAFGGGLFDSRRGFAVVFDNTTKPQREGQKRHFEGLKTELRLFFSRI